MTYAQTIDFLYSCLPAYHRVGKAAYKANLDNTTRLDEYLRHPHEKYRTIHIAGTNGKGSVSHMLASVLQEAGYKTGLYTSPHLRDFRERIKVNGRMIPRKAVTDFVRDHNEIIRTISPSFFEMTVAMAFDHFRMSGVDVAVIETGLGGRLDSTNIITPVLSVVTNIGHDHMDLLGDTLEKVAEEKAGIIKDGIPVVIGETQKNVDAVFISFAKRRNSEICFADRRFRCSLGNSISIKGVRSYEISDSERNLLIKGITPLAGDYQTRNIQAVYQAADLLGRSFPLTDLCLRNGIKRTVANTGLQGRWQILSSKPLTVCDTGHNKEGIEYVMRQISGIPKTGLHIVTGFVRDKDVGSILPLFPSDAKYYFTKASVQRAMDEKELAARAAESGLRGNCYADVKSAFEAAKHEALDSDMIFIGGSNFIVAEVI